MDDNFAYGLSEKNRNYIVGIVFGALLVFGPVQPYGMFIRVAYLAAIPAILWLALLYVGGKLDMDPFDNDRLNSGITAAVAGMLIVAAYQSANPLAIAELTRDQVQILHRTSESKIVSENPALDPKGMGFANIVTRPC